MIVICLQLPEKETATETVAVIETERPAGRSDKLTSGTSKSVVPLIVKSNFSGLLPE